MLGSPDRPGAARASTRGQANGFKGFTKAAGDGFSSCFGLGAGWAEVRAECDIGVLVNSSRSTHLGLALRAAAVEVPDSNARLSRVLWDYRQNGQDKWRGWESRM